jgi:ABC-type Fe3+-hydroxamate transport system substrate-binding protein
MSKPFPRVAGWAAWRVAASQILASRAGARSVVLHAALVLLCAGPALAVRVVVDATGRSIPLPDRPHRIVCLAPSIADTVFDLGAGEDVVGVSDFTRFPAEAAKKPSIGGLRPSLERIAMLHPDLVLGIGGFNDAESIRGIERMGVPVFLVASSGGLAGMYRSIDSIGRALDREAAAHGLIAWLRSRERRVRDRAASLPVHPSVFVVISLDPCMTAGRGAFVTELIEAAGALSVTDDIPREWMNLSIETVIPKQPQYILLFRDSPFGLEQMRERPGWRSLFAVQQGRVLHIDDRLQYPSPVAFDALDGFARQLREAVLH